MRKAHFEEAQSKINRKLRVRNLCCNIFVVFLKCTLEKGLGGFQHEKSRNPALNVLRRHEPVATYTIFPDTPAVDSGVKQAQVFVGRDSWVADVYPMKSGKQFVNTLEDNMRRRGAMDKLLSDLA